jgi:hypothetical protein
VAIVVVQSRTGKIKKARIGLINSSSELRITF